MAAPDSAKYILQVPDVALANAQALSTITPPDGQIDALLKVTFSTGVLSAGLPDVDFLAPNNNLLSLKSLTPVAGGIVYAVTSDQFDILPPGDETDILSWNSSGEPVYITPPSAVQTYVTVNEEEGLPFARQLAVGTGLTLTDAGAGSTITITPGPFLTSFINSATGPATGLQAITAPNTVTLRTLADSSSVQWTTNVSEGNPVATVINDSSIQKVSVQKDGGSIGSRSILNFIEGPGMTITAAENIPENRIDLTFESTGDITDAKYILQEFPDPNPFPNAQSLAALGSGLLKNTTGTGVLSIATPNADYMVPNLLLLSLSGVTMTEGGLLVGGLNNSLTNLPMGTANQVLTVVNTLGAPYLGWTTINNASTQASYITLADESSNLPNSFSLRSLQFGLLKLAPGGSSNTILTNAYQGVDFLPPFINFGLGTSNTAGSFTTSGLGNATINTTAVQTNSAIFFQPTNAAALTGLPQVLSSNIVPGVSFTVTGGGAVANYNWILINPKTS